MPEQDSPPESRNSPTSTLTRETVHEWVGTAFETIARRFPQLASLIEQHRSTIVSLINIHCPQGADSCEGLSNIERQVDGYFLLAQEDTQSGIESELVDAEMREYGNITGQIRSFFAGRTIIQVPRDQPRVAESAQEEEAKTSEVVQVDALPFCKFQEVWNGVIGERGSIWTPSSKEANAAFNTYLGGQRIMVADEQFGDSLGFLYMDLPRGGIDNWMYLEHFRIVLVALLQQMEKTLEGGCEAYAREYRERYLDGVETLEGMAGSQYSLSAAQEIGTPVIWKSCLHKICQDAHERYSIDIEAEEALVVFREGHVGQLFEREYTSLFRREVELLRQMPPCISRDRFTELERQLQVDLEQCNDLLSTHVVPHLGSAVASRVHECHVRTLLDVRNGVGSYLDTTAKEDPHGISVLFDQREALSTGEPQTKARGLEAVHSFEPTIGKLGFIHVNSYVCGQLLQAYPEEQTKAFDRYVRTHAETFGMRWITARTKFQSQQLAISSDLPDVIDIQKFQQFMTDFRKVFEPLRRVYMSAIGEPAVEYSYQFYVDSMEQLESAVLRVFSLQLPSTVQAPSDVPTSGAVTREEVYTALQLANRRADSICNSVWDPEKGDAVCDYMEKQIQNAVASLPETITRVPDLENIIFWLIGRLEAMNTDGYGGKLDKFDWSREINRAQFEVALQRICTRLPGGDSTEAVLRKMPVVPITGEEVDSVDREELLEELLDGLKKAEARVASSGLRASDMVAKEGPSQAYRDAMVEQQEMSQEMGRVVREKQNNKRLTSAQRKEGKKKRAKEARKARRKPQKNILADYFARLRDALEQYMSCWCPQKICSQGPLLGLGSFLLEYSYQSRLCLEGRGIASEDDVWRVMTWIDEATIPTIGFASALVDARGEDSETDTEHRTGEGERSQSQTLHVDPPPALARALEGNRLLDGEYLNGAISGVCKSAEAELPKRCNAKHEARVHLLRIVWHFRRIAFDICLFYTDDGPIQEYDDYQRFYGDLATGIDALRSSESEHSTQVKSFLSERLITARMEIEKRLCQETERREMQEALVPLDDPQISAGQYQAFFTRYAGNLLAQRCRQFLYSCITPSMQSDQVRSIGLAVDQAFQSLLNALTELVQSRCDQTSGGMLTLQELQGCFSDLVARVSVEDLGLPPGTEERFRTQVLGSIHGEISQNNTATELFQNLPPSDSVDDPSSLIGGEISSLLEVQDQQGIISLLQTASTHYTHTREHLIALEGLVDLIQEAMVQNEGASRDLDELASALGVLCDLYLCAGGAAMDPGEQQASSRRALQALEHLRHTANKMNTTMYSREGREQRREIAEGLMHLENTLQALCHTYFSKDYEAERS